MDWVPRLRFVIAFAIAAIWVTSMPQCSMELIVSVTTSMNQQALAKTRIAEMIETATLHVVMMNKKTVESVVAGGEIVSTALEFRR